MCTQEVSQGPHYFAGGCCEGVVQLDSKLYQTVAEPSEKQSQAYLDTIEQLEIAVDAYQPKTEDGETHADMAEIANRLRGIIAEERRQVEAVLAV